MTDIFSNVDNLVVNPNNAWLPYNRIGHHVVELQDGDWFLNSNNPVLDPLFFDLGIILYTDKTGKSALNPHGMEPLVFTLSLLREFVCQRPDCWRPLGSCEITCGVGSHFEASVKKPQEWRTGRQ